jgi:phospholipid transport system substrate-binding protein
MMKKIWAYFIGLVMFFALSGAAMAGDGAYDLISNVSNNLFPKLTKQTVANPSALKNLVKTDLMPYVDIKYAAYKVLGANIRSTNEEQRKRFVQAFETYIIDTYSSALGKYDNHSLVIDPKVVGDAKSSIVNVSLKTGDGNQYQIAFKLRQNQKTGEWKVYDMVAEGISLLSSKQAEFNDLIVKNGIDKVCQMLEEHNLPSSK